MANPYSQLNYLRLTKRAQKAMIPLEEKYDEGRSICYAIPHEYVDYDEDNPPSKQEAYYMCKGCPMLVECGRFAAASKPYIGVWGGEVYHEGKRLYD